MCSKNVNGDALPIIWSFSDRRKNGWIGNWCAIWIMKHKQMLYDFAEFIQWYFSTNSTHQVLNQNNKPK